MERILKSIDLILENCDVINIAAEDMSLTDSSYMVC